MPSSKKKTPGQKCVKKHGASCSSGSEPGKRPSPALRRLLPSVLRGLAVSPGCRVANIRHRVQAAPTWQAGRGGTRCPGREGAVTEWAPPWGHVRVSRRLHRFPDPRPDRRWDVRPRNGGVLDQNRTETEHGFRATDGTPRLLLTGRGDGGAGTRRRGRDVCRQEGAGGCSLTRLPHPGHSGCRVWTASWAEGGPCGNMAVPSPCRAFP